MNKIPEIARISSFEGDDIVQVFGENFDMDTKLYVWYNKTQNDKNDADLTKFEKLGVDAAIAYKIELAKNNTSPITEENASGRIEELLPAVPPEDAIVYDACDLADKAIYFGEEAGPQPVDGKYKRLENYTCVIWLKNEAGFSKPYIANRPEIRTLSETETVPGGRISIYGINFGKPASFSDGTHFAKVSMLKNKATGEFVRPIAVEETAYWHNLQRFTADFIVPEDTLPGEYEVYLHSGKCGIFGWSEPVSLAVKPALSITDYYCTKWNRMAGTNPARPKCEVIEMAADKGALYDYAADMQAAIDKLSSMGGGILSLSSGTFRISETVYVKKGVVILGNGNSTVIRALEDGLFYQDLSRMKFAVRPDGRRGWANDWYEHYLKHRQAALMVLTGDCGTDSIRLELGDGANLGIVVAGEDCDHADNVFVNKTEVDAMCLSELEHDGLYGAICAALVVGARTQNFVSWCSKFKSTYCVQILPARHEHMALINNEFNCHPRQIGESHISGIRHAIISNNTFIGGRRAFTGQGGLSNCWIYQNRTLDVARAGGAEETYMSEHGEGEWNGKAIDFGEDYIIIKEKSIEDIFVRGAGEDVAKILDCYGRFVFILSGRGFGQYFKLIDAVKVAEGEYKLQFAEKFRVKPDLDTTYTMVIGTHHNIWIDNNTTLSNGHSQFVWNCGFENMIIGHQMELAAGVYMHAVYHENFTARGSFKNLKAVCAFNTFSDCQGRASGAGIKFSPKSLNKDLSGIPEMEDYALTGGVFGNCIKACTFDGSEGLIYTKNIWGYPDEPYPVAIQFTGSYNRAVANHIRGYRKAYAVLGNYVGNCFARNNVTANETLFIGDGTPIGVDTRNG